MSAGEKTGKTKYKTKQKTKYLKHKPARESIYSGDDEAERNKFRRAMGKCRAFIPDSCSKRTRISHPSIPQYLRAVNRVRGVISNTNTWL